MGRSKLGGRDVSDWRKLFKAMSVREWAHELSRKELLVILLYIGTTLVGYAIMGLLSR